MSVRAWYAKPRAVSGTGVGRQVKRETALVSYNDLDAGTLVTEYVDRLPCDWWHISVIDIALMTCGMHKIVVNNGIKIGWDHATCMWGETGGINIKKEQEQAVIALLEKKDVFAVLPTGFGKSLIYQSYSSAKSEIDAVSPAVIVIIPPQSVAEEQVRNSEFDIKAAPLSLDEEKLRAVASGEVQVLYASAEEALDDLFIDLF